jgi:hypothetical protein
MQLRDARHTAGDALQYGESMREGSTVMNKLLVILALALALAAGTVIDAVTIAQAAHADCISTK